MIDILIVDDDPQIRKLLEEILKAEYTCMTAGNTVQARHRLEEQSFDLVLCDIRMPGESGIDLARDLTTTSPDIAVILVSGIDDLQTTQLAIELGIYGYIIKPFNNIQDVYYETSVDGTILELSPSIESATGYTRENLIGKTVDVLYVEPKSRDALIDRLIETEKVHDYEVILKNKDGRPIHAALSATLVKDQAAQPLKLIGIIRDITERKKIDQKQKQLMADLNETLKKLKNAQAQMLHAEKMSSIGQLSAGVAHEINTPIQLKQRRPNSSFNFHWTIHH